MGMSSDSMLAFGFTIGDEDGPPAFLGECDDMEDFIAGPYSAGADFAARRALVKACPADLVVYSSYGYPMYALVVRGTELTAARGEMVEVTAERLAVPPERVEAFKGWCEEHGVEYKEPKWLLCSVYG